MRWSDLLDASLASLRQRFARTALTVLGVMIGTMSVVLMVSLGIGMTQSLMDQMGSNTSLTRVTVTGGAGGGMFADGGLGTTTTSSSGEEIVLNEATVAMLAEMPGVESVDPVYSVSATARVGTTDGYLMIMGMSPEALKRAGLELGTGRLPLPGDGLAVVVGDKVDWNFSMDPMTGDVPDIDWANSQMFLTFEDTAPASEETTTATPSKRFVVPVTGVLAGSDQTWGENDMNTFADLDQLVAALEKAFPGRALPGQPATADGKPKGNTFVYSQLNLTAESPERAESLTSELRDQGYEASSNIEFIRAIQSQSAIIQAIFGGIGFVSLFVAAIGIANTMMMSVYERTKQIGVMKVLGASLRDIRNLFLAESATIGLVGGIVGLLLSLLISAGINAILGPAMGEGMVVSAIPVWLMLTSVVFATLIGMVAGLIPAHRAMRLSPLAAIRTE